MKFKTILHSEQTEDGKKSQVFSLVYEDNQGREICVPLSQLEKEKGLYDALFGDCNKQRTVLFRPFKDHAEFEAVSKVRLLDFIYLKSRVWDTRLYKYVAYLGFYSNLKDEYLILSGKEYALHVLFDCYSYSFDGITYFPFSVKNE